MDILLDEESHDAIFVNGATPVTSGVAEGLKQRLKIKLLTFKGEWFLNINYGTPYFQQIFGKRRTKGSVDIIFRQLIEEDQDVASLSSFESSLSSDRIYSLSFSVRSVTGETIEIQELEVGI